MGKTTMTMMTAILCVGVAVFANDRLAAINSTQADWELMIGQMVPKMRNMQLRRIQEKAGREARAKANDNSVHADKDGEPPFDSDGNVVLAFAEKLVAEWFAYRGKEYCVAKENSKDDKHEPPLKLDYGCTWRSLNQDWRNTFEKSGITKWASMEQDGTHINCVIVDAMGEVVKKENETCKTPPFKPRISG